MIEQMTDLTDASKQRRLAGAALEFLGLDESRFSVAGMGEVKREKTEASDAMNRNRPEFLRSEK